MNAGWKTVKLSEIALIGAGNSAPQETDDFSEGGPLFVRTSDVGEVKFGTVVTARDRLSPRGAKGMRLWKSGTILIPKSGASTFVNHRVILGTDAHVSSHLATIAADTAKADPRFLLYYLSTVRAQDLIQDQSYPSLKLPEIGSIEIPLPPLAEQKRIVALLDEAFAGIDEAISMIESQSASIKQLLESYLGGVFSTKQHGWDTHKLKECTIIIMGQSPEGSTYNAKGIGTPLINGPVEFSADAFGETVKEKWTTEPTKLCKRGDLILCVRGSTTGRMNIAGFDACIGRGVAAIRAKQSQSWVNHFVNASRSKILGMGKGATFPNVSADDIGQMELTIPPADMQELLSKKFDNLRLLNADMCRSMEKRASLLKTLKSSFLAQAFAGELTV
jgi:type I restriction enzyme S subunit